MNPNNQQPTKSMPPIAIALVACGGGVVGYDYATWMEVSPLVGAIIGLIISAIMVNVLNHIMRDPDRKIREGCMALGGFAGAIFGLTLATDNNAEGWGFFYYHGDLRQYRCGAGEHGGLASVLRSLSTAVD